MKQFYVEQKYTVVPKRIWFAKKPKIIGGTGRLCNRSLEWDKNRTAMQRVVDRVHNDWEMYPRRKTKFKAYKRYFLDRVQFYFSTQDDD